jgi:hypothetical protein
MISAGSGNDMRAIFISYRREDAEGQAGRLFADLTHHFGEDAVFMDVAAIEPGRDFRRAIDQQVASCGVLLALIGKRWVTARNESGARRLDDPMDFVRLETASALKRDIPVIPVLVQGATMPRVEDLPEDLKEIAFRNGIELTHARWDSDMQLLVKALRPYVQVTQAPPASSPQSAPSAPGSSRVIPTRAIIAGLFSVLVLAGGWYLWQRPTETHTLPKEQEARKYRSLVGTWLSRSQTLCTLTFQTDDGKNVEGSCDNIGFIHKFAGVYNTETSIKITITRIDRESGCSTTVKGNIEIVDNNTIEVSQDGWDGCDVKTEPVIKMQLSRS